MGIRISLVVDWILKFIYLLQFFRRSPYYCVYIYYIYVTGLLQ